MDWVAIADDKRRRHADGVERARTDERALVRQGNVAYAAGLASLMAGDGDAAAEWLRVAAADWRRSWDVGAATESWGRPIGALKASLLAGDEQAAQELARWTVGLGTATAASPIGRYAGCLALLVLERWSEARSTAESLRDRDDFPADVGDALSAVAAHDAAGVAGAVEAVVRSFEQRDGYLEDVAVADTALVLGLLARRRGLTVELPPSPLLPGRS